MSSTVISQGFIGVLMTPVGKEGVEETMEKLESLTDGFLKISYEGGLLFSDDFEKKSYGQRDFNGDLFIVGGLDITKLEEFVAAAKAVGLEIDCNTAQPYTCIWYNGADCPVSMLSKEDFLAGKV